jgi:hypothetical protein
MKLNTRPGARGLSRLFGGPLSADREGGHAARSRWCAPGFAKVPGGLGEAKKVRGKAVLRANHLHPDETPVLEIEDDLRQVFLSRGTGTVTRPADR